MIIVLICPVVSQHIWFRLHLTSSHGQEVGKQLRWEIDLNSSHGGTQWEGPVGPGCCWRPKQAVEVCWEMEFFYGEYCDLIGWFNVQSPCWLMISLGILLTIFWGGLSHAMRGIPLWKGIKGRQRIVLNTAPTSWICWLVLICWSLCLKRFLRFY